MEGEVVRMVKDKGFGFIKASTGKEYFFHASVLKNCKFQDVEVGQTVTFEDEEGERGPRAADVFI